MHALLKRNYLSHSGRESVMNMNEFDHDRNDIYNEWWITSPVGRALPGLTELIDHGDQAVSKAAASNNHVGSQNPQWAHKDQMNGAQSKGWPGGNPRHLKDKDPLRPASWGRRALRDIVPPSAVWPAYPENRNSSGENRWGGFSTSVGKGSNPPLPIERKVRFISGGPDPRSHHLAGIQPPQVVGPWNSNI